MSEKTMRQQYLTKEISKKEYITHLAEMQGITYKEYIDRQVQKNGYENYNDYVRHMKHKRDKGSPFMENKSCSLYLGVGIAEKYLSKIFQNVQRMPHGNPGYDFICNKGYKIDVKCVCLGKTNNTWCFNIYENKIADYFLLLAFMSREDLDKPIHLWLIKSDEVISTNKDDIKLNERVNLKIPNTPKILARFAKFEQTDKLEELKKCCISVITK